MKGTLNLQVAGTGYRSEGKIKDKLGLRKARTREDDDRTEIERKAVDL
jgi:hypothetical protein